MVDVAQLVRASDCGSEGRGFEPLLPPARSLEKETFFVFQEAPSRLSGDSFSIVRRLLFGCPGVYGPSSLQFPGSLHNALPDTLNPTPFSPKPFRFQHNSIPGRPASAPARRCPKPFRPQHNFGPGRLAPPQSQRKPISPRLDPSANPLRPPSNARLRESTFVEAPLLKPTRPNNHKKSGRMLPFSRSAFESGFRLPSGRHPRTR